MKASTVKSLSTEDNFYLSTLAPVNHDQDAPFRGLDAVLLVVLFLEIAVVVRLLLAN